MLNSWVTKPAGGLAALALSACASLPPGVTSTSPKPASSYVSARSLDAPLGPWPADGWWTRYGDAQLNALMSEALAGSPTLAQAEARLRKAQASRSAAQASLLPSVIGNGQIEEQRQSAKYLFPPAFLPKGYQDYGQVTLNLNWELDFWGKNRAAVAAATSEARAASADAAEARLLLTTDIASTYAILARLDADREVAIEATRVREETATLVSQRVANGLDTQAELRQARAGAPAGRAQVAAIDEEIAQTRDALAALAGDGPDRGLALAAPTPAKLPAFGLPADIRLSLVGRRPDVVAARWRAEAAASRIHEAKAAFYPDVNLQGYFGEQSLHLSQLITPGATIGSIGPAVTLPIFEGGRLRANLKGARADRDAAVAAYDGALTEALRQVADVAASERALGVRLSESRLALESYEGAYKVARLRYEGGLSTFQSVLLAEDAVLAQRQAVSDLESRAFTLDIALVRALGGGFGEPPRSDLALNGSAKP